MNWLRHLGSQLRKSLRNLLLRGRWLQWWIGRKSRILERAYLTEVLRSSRTPTAPDAALESRFRASSQARIRTILFIADCEWESHELLPELRKIARVEVLDLGPSLESQSDASRLPSAVVQTLESFVKQPQAWEPDVVLFYARPRLLSAAAFDLLRRRWSCLLMGMNLDDKMEFFPYDIFNAENDNYQKWARLFDLNLSSSRLAVEWYRQHGLPVRYCPMGFHQAPDLVTPPTSLDYEYPMSFVGSWRAERAEVMAQLTRQGVPISVFGHGWAKSERAERAASIYRRTQINLGLGFITSVAGITNVKARDFECPGAGACYATTFNWELADHYEIGKEILCYRSVDELVELYAFYARRPEACLRLAQAAHRRCAAEHTWEQRFRRIFQSAGFRT
jgi:hypothetical protein